MPQVRRHPVASPRSVMMRIFGLSPRLCPAVWAARSASLPRLFLKKLVSDVLDRIDQFPDFDPRRHYQLTLTSAEMTDAERAVSVDDIELPQ